ncbi:hypothetical protein BJ508DRAFT_304952 [Ascobolus immersus RN42]|uniref:Uncharacterized protein n=1 Tax=Ascobolus immersus RN42 TaxID=1160509 RepID=A0A3N4IAU9_ASCIM|nr:hypothetical protein BJ508DRAFT_304952 [Ascobolus immersus RN42]
MVPRPPTPLSSEVILQTANLIQIPQFENITSTNTPEENINALADLISNQNSRPVSPFSEGIDLQDESARRLAGLLFQVFTESHAIKARESNESKDEIDRLHTRNFEQAMNILSQLQPEHLSIRASDIDQEYGRLTDLWRRLNGLVTESRQIPPGIVAEDTMQFISSWCQVVFGDFMAVVAFMMHLKWTLATSNRTNGTGKSPANFFSSTTVFGGAQASETGVHRTFLQEWNQTVVELTG